MTVTECWIAIYGSHGRTDDPPRSYLTVCKDGRYVKPYLLIGEVKVLPFMVAADHTPIGILLDRLEEYPEEVADCDPDTVRQCVAYLRTKYPNGV